MINITPPMATTLRRCFCAAYWLALLAIFVEAFRIRAALPAQPFADPDSWGYLFPSLSALTGHEFIHADKRSFPYPLFLLLIQRGFGGLDAIVRVQHGVGLASGALLLWVWHRLAKFHPLAWETWIVHRVLGCVMLYAYLMPLFTVEMEHTLRPEAVFPFFTILTIGLAAQYYRLFYQRRKFGLAFLVGTALAFNSVLVYFLKPAWGFATLGALAPVIVSMFGLKKRFIYGVGIVFVAGALAYLALWAPEQRLIRAYDPSSPKFLPATLFVYHAPMVRDEIAAELKQPGTLRFSRDFMEDVVKLIDENQKTGDARCFPFIGFNPELLMSKDTFFGMLDRTFWKSAAPGAEFCWHFYLAAWRHQPVRMLAAIVKQMKIPNSSQWRGPFQCFDAELRISDRARCTLDSLAPTTVSKPYPPFENFVAFWEMRCNSKDILRQSPKVAVIHERMRMSYEGLVGGCILLALGVTLGFLWKPVHNGALIGCVWLLVGLSSLLFWKNFMIALAASTKVSRYVSQFLSLSTAIGFWRDGVGIALVGCAWWAVYLYSLSFWNTLTVALTVSTEYNRYLWGQMSFTLLANAWAILLGYIVVSRVCRTGLFYFKRRAEHASRKAEAPEPCR